MPAANVQVDQVEPRLHVRVVELDARGLVILERGQHVEIGHDAPAIIVDLRLEIFRG